MTYSAYIFYSWLIYICTLLLFKKKSDSLKFNITFAVNVFNKIQLSTMLSNISLVITHQSIVVVFIIYNNIPVNVKINTYHVLKHSTVVL